MESFLTAAAVPFHPPSYAREGEDWLGGREAAHRILFLLGDQLAEELQDPASGVSAFILGPRVARLGHRQFPSILNCLQGQTTIPPYRLCQLTCTARASKGGGEQEEVVLYAREAGPARSGSCPSYWLALAALLKMLLQSGAWDFP
jgi:hypothetical protein